MVCGVRGTHFSMLFNPDTKALDLNVFEGVVGAASGGTTQLFSHGQGGHFLNGHWDGKFANAGSPSKGESGNNGGKGSSGGSSGNGSGSNSNNGNNSGNNGGSNGNSGTDNGEDTSNGGSTNNPTSGSGNSPANPEGGSQGLQTNSCLGDLNNQFVTGILINGDNNLNASQQSVKIHIVVPPGEAVP